MRKFKAWTRSVCATMAESNTQYLCNIDEANRQVQEFQGTFLKISSHLNQLAMDNKDLIAANEALSSKLQALNDHPVKVDAETQTDVADFDNSDDLFATQSSASVLSPEKAEPTLIRRKGGSGRVADDAELSPDVCKSKWEQQRQRNKQRAEKLVQLSPILQSRKQKSIRTLKSRTAAHPYVERPVRGKVERAKLNGYLCLECKPFFEALSIPDEERQKLINKCSKHRAKFDPGLDKQTPASFWNPKFSGSWSD